MCTVSDRRHSGREVGDQDPRGERGERDPS